MVRRSSKKQSSVIPFASPFPLAGRNLANSNVLNAIYRRRIARVISRKSGEAIAYIVPAAQFNVAANKSNDNDNNSSSPSLLCSSPNGGIEALNSPPMTLGSALRPAGHADP
ncbi:hypothetical protein GW17_00033425 [Ensete ventricosum]|nr:hypothetical protein GW17_00033425 [Ensete ventricosum]